MIGIWRHIRSSSRTGSRTPSRTGGRSGKRTGATGSWSLIKSRWCRTLWSKGDGYCLAIQLPKVTSHYYAPCTLTPSRRRCTPQIRGSIVRDAKTCISTPFSDGCASHKGSTSPPPHPSLPTVASISCLNQRILKKSSIAKYTRRLILTLPFSRRESHSLSPNEYIPLFLNRGYSTLIINTAGHWTTTLFGDYGPKEAAAFEGPN